MLDNLTLVNGDGNIRKAEELFTEEQMNHPAVKEAARLGAEAGRKLKEAFLFEPMKEDIEVNAINLKVTDN